MNERRIEKLRATFLKQLVEQDEYERFEKTGKYTGAVIVRKETADD